MVNSGRPRHFFYRCNFFKLNKIPLFVHYRYFVKYRQVRCLFCSREPYRNIRLLFSFHRLYLSRDIPLKNTTYGPCYLPYRKTGHRSLIVIHLDPDLFLAGLVIPCNISRSVDSFKRFHIFSGYFVQCIKILTAYLCLYSFSNRRPGFRSIKTQIIKTLHVFCFLPDLVYYLLNLSFSILLLCKINRYLNKITCLPSEGVIAVFFYLSYCCHICIQFFGRKLLHNILYRLHQRACHFKGRSYRGLPSYKKVIYARSWEQYELYNSSRHYPAYNKNTCYA